MSLPYSAPTLTYVLTRRHTRPLHSVSALAGPVVPQVRLLPQICQELHRKGLRRLPAMVHGAGALTARVVPFRVPRSPFPLLSQAVRVGPKVLLHHVPLSLPLPRSIFDSETHGFQICDYAPQLCILERNTHSLPRVRLACGNTDNTNTGNI